MKRIFSSMLVIIFIFISVISVNAYSVKTYIPSTKSFNYYRHSSLPLLLYSDTPSAANKWTDVSSCDITFTYSGESNGTIDFTDSRSDVACLNFAGLSSYGFPATANGACATLKNTRYSNFDILLNSTKAWSDSQGSLSPLGIITHEFGHAGGLDEIYIGPPVGEYPTMFAYNTDLLGNDISYNLRTLETDDILGIRYVSSQIN